jgi:hypothetical protein
MRQSNRLLMPRPVGVAVRAPFREVLLADGFASEFRREDGPDFRQGIEPTMKRLAMAKPSRD